MLQNVILRSGGNLPFATFGSEKVNRLRPKSDQHQFSPNKFNTLWREKIISIYKMMGKPFNLLSNSLYYFFKEMYGDQSGEFVCG